MFNTYQSARGNFHECCQLYFAQSCVNIYLTQFSISLSSKYLNNDLIDSLPFQNHSPKVLNPNSKA